MIFTWELQKLAIEPSGKRFTRSQMANQSFTRHDKREVVYLNYPPSVSPGLRINREPRNLAITPPEGRCTHEIVVSRAGAKLRSHLWRTAAASNGTRAHRDERPMVVQGSWHRRDVKLLKNNSLINLQEGIELLAQALQRSTLEEAVCCYFLRPTYCFHLGKVKGKTCFSSPDVLVTLQVVLFDISLSASLEWFVPEQSCKCSTSAFSGCS